FLDKKDQKSRLYSNPAILPAISDGFAPKLAPTASGLKHGCSLPPPMAQNRDLNKAGPNNARRF
ncbi:MAG TPA: hypothetical protein PLO67_19380, partial [Saprospiraceae bacterium]|nr:hypothetical protein [Saprospiraceae bacterium]